MYNPYQVRRFGEIIDFWEESEGSFYVAYKYFGKYVLIHERSNEIVIITGPEDERLLRIFRINPDNVLIRKARIQFVLRKGGYRINYEAERGQPRKSRLRQ
jgi:hypothetical protein